MSFDPDSPATAARRAIRVAIDGPASSGKGTVARLVARHLGYVWVDTGALYRAVALCARRAGVDWTDADAVGALAARVRFAWEPGEPGDDEPRLTADGVDVSEAVRAEDIGAGASIVAVIPGVRAALLQVQRDLGAEGGVVMDGRDIGTVVLPDAELKVYLDASLAERARRRWLQFPSRSFEDVRDDLAARDARDSGRAVAPLRAAEDAVRLDTTDLPIDEAVDRIVEMARGRGA